MGERWQRWQTRLRSDRAENVFGITLMVLLTVCAVALTALSWPGSAWSHAAPVVVVYVLGCLLAGTVLAVLVPRWPVRFMQETRRFSRSQHWALSGMWIPIGFAFTLPFSLTFAETYACERGDGILVRTSWTDSSEENGTKSGVYTHDGETYEINISDREWIERQVRPPEPPTEDNAYYTRTYRVPWAGSSMVCATTESDRNDLVGVGVMGTVASAGAVAGALSLLRRRRGRA